MYWSLLHVIPYLNTLNTVLSAREIFLFLYMLGHQRDSWTQQISWHNWDPDLMILIKVNGRIHTLQWLLLAVCLLRQIPMSPCLLPFITQRLSSWLWLHWLWAGIPLLKSVMVGLTILSELFLVLNEGVDSEMQNILCRETNTQSSPVRLQNIRSAEPQLRIPSNH